MRQAGQSAGASGAQDRKPYGDLPSSQTEAQRSATTPTIERSNSFDRGDEKRAFSSAQAPPPVPPHTTGIIAPTSTASTENMSQIGQQPALHLQTRESSSGGRKPVQTSQMGTDSPIPASTTSTASKYSQESGFHPDYTRVNDYSAGTGPPMQPNTAPPPVSSNVPSRFPPRKSSIGTGQPELSTITPRQESLSSRHDDSGSPISSKPAAGKALPFIRPADIYRRHAEEMAEKQRQSMDTTRPSMDSLQDTIHDNSLPASRPPMDDHIESLGSNTTGPQYYDSENYHDRASSHSSRGLLPVLEPVIERKSEYGFDNYDTSHLKSPVAPSFDEPRAEEAAGDDVEETRRFSTSPKLPDLNRMSSFGMDIFLKPSEKPPPLPTTREEDETTPTLASTSTFATQAQPGLKTQPSLGFTSVVHQAFDTSLPPQTPASETGSGIRRADSESTGTTGISPIMSRVPSSAAEARARAVDPKDNDTPTIARTLGTDSSPTSAQATFTDAASSQSGEQDVLFQPGHRRDISAPSSNNGPAKTPVIANKGAVASQSVHVSEATTASNSDNTTPSNDEHMTGGGGEAFARPSLPGEWVSYAPSEPHDIGDVEEAMTKGSVAASKSSTIDIRKSLTPDLEKDEAASASEALTTPKPDIKRQASDISSAGPTPPAKDRPQQGSLPRTEEQPTSLTTPNVNDLEDMSADASKARASGQGSISDEDSDRLRDEIIKSLSPKPSDISSRQLGREPEYDNARESTYLPSEYDNYWADTGNEPGVPDVPAHLKQSISKTTPEPVNSATSPTIAPLNTTKANRPPIPAQHRFSWEAPSEEIITAPASESGHTGGPAEDMHQSVDAANTPHVQSIPAIGSTGTTAALDSIADHNDTSSQLRTSRDLPILSPGSANLLHDDEKIAVEHGDEREIAAAELTRESKSIAQDTTGSVAARSSPQVTSPAQVAFAERQSSIPDQKSPVNASTFSIARTPPEEEHPAHRTPSATSPLELTGTTSLSAVPTSAGFVPKARAVSDFSKITPFKDILAIASAERRIQAYNESRHQFAIMESGLSDWLATMRSNVNESELNSTGNQISTARSRAPKAGSAPLSQPYYQQYLNASSPTSISSPTSPRPQTAGAGLSGQQSSGFSSGQRSSSQQVQAKGKELLSSAGKFGGLASKAGKGLLSKGKSKFRASGNDKVD